MAPAPPAERSAPRLYDERLGELPDRYQDDAFVALPLDPHSLFVYWDFAPGTTAEAARELPGARAVLRILEGGQPRQEFDFALESRSFYVHGLTPGGTYQAEIQFVSSDGRRRRIGQLSNPVGLPPQGPSSLVDDRFIAFPWDRGPLSAAAFEPRGAPGTPQHAELGELSATGASSWPPLRPWLPGGVRSAGVDWPGAGDRH